MEIERNGASTDDLERFLTREIKKIMQRAAFTTPAAPRMTDFTIKAVEQEPKRAKKAA